MAAVAVAMLLGLGGRPGALAGYCLIVFTALGLLWSARPLTRPYALVVVAAPMFVIGWVGAYHDAIVVSSVAFALAYLATLAAVLEVLRRRVEQISTPVMCEIVVIAVAVGAVIAQFRWHSQESEAVGFAGLDLAVSIVGVVFLLSFLGRRSDKEMRLFGSAAGVAIAVELLDSFQRTQEVFGLQLVVLSASSFLLVAMAAKVESRSMLLASPASLRRPLGPLQLMVAAASIAVPIILAGHAGSLGGVRQALGLLGASLVSLSAATLRVAFLITQRDRSFAMERQLRLLGEDLVGSDDTDVARTAAAHLADFVPDAVVSLVESQGHTVRPIVVPMSPLELDLQRQLHDPVGAIDGLHVLDGARVPTGRVTSVVSGPVQPSGRRLLLVVADRQRLDPHVREQLRSAVAQLGLATTIASLREERHRERSDARFRSLVGDSHDIVVVVDRRDQVSLVGPTVVPLLGFTETDLMGRSPLRWVHPNDRPLAERVIAGAEGRNGHGVDVRVAHRDGHYLWFHLTARDLRDDTEVGGLVLNFADVHEAKLAEQQLRLSEARNRALVENSTDVLGLIDEDFTITYVSESVERLLGFTATDLVGTSIWGLLSADSQSAIERLGSDPFLDARSLDLEILTKWGERRTYAVTVSPVDLERRREFAVSLSDRTEHRRLEATLKDLAERDEQTGLLNRSAFITEVDAMLARRNGSVAVLALDVDDFRTVNAALGHAAGDALLRNVGGRLQTTLRSEDVAARLGNDDFAVAVVADDAGQAHALARRVLEVFGREFDLGGRQRTVTASVGMAMAEDGVGPDELLQRATTALNRAKADEHERIVEFESTMQQASLDRFLLVADLDKAVEAEEFALVYQPIVNLRSGRVSGVEALVRWNHPERGFVSPGVFIPVAEQLGLINKIGRWVAAEGARQLEAWRREVPGSDLLTMAINVSLMQVEEFQEIELLHAMITEHLPASLFTFELTESVFAENPLLVRSRLEQVRATGTRIAIDDFGTGAAGFNHLRDLPFDVVKIDRSFVDDIGGRPGPGRRDNERLVHRMIELATGLGAKTVAEGIERPQQLERLRELGCHYGQGFYLGRPMEARQLAQWFLRGRDGSAPFLLETAPEASV